MSPVLLTLALGFTSAPVSTPVKSIDYLGPIDVKIRVDPTISRHFNLDLASYSTLSEQVAYEVVGDKLSIKAKGGAWAGRKSDKAIYITVKSLEKLRLQGAANVTVTGDTQNICISANVRGQINFYGKTQNLDLKQRGSGHISISDLTGEFAKINVRGRGQATLKGQVKEAAFSVAQNAHIDAKGLRVTQKADVSTSGTGELLMCLVGQLGKTHIFGATDVKNQCALTTDTNLLTQHQP